MNDQVAVSPCIRHEARAFYAQHADEQEKLDREAPALSVNYPGLKAGAYRTP